MTNFAERAGTTQDGWDEAASIVAVILFDHTVHGIDAAVPKPRSESAGEAQEAECQKLLDDFEALPEAEQEKYLTSASQLLATAVNIFQSHCDCPACTLKRLVRMGLTVSRDTGEVSDLLDKLMPEGMDADVPCRPAFDVDTAESVRQMVAQGVPFDSIIAAIQNNDNMGIADALAFYEKATGNPIPIQEQ